MKKHISLLAVAASLATASVSSAQVQLVAGWDFGQFTFTGWSPTSPAQDVAATSIPAGYTEVGAGFTPVSQHDQVDGVTPVNAGTGVIYWDGTNGSSLFDAETFNGEIQAGFGTTTINATMANTSVLGTQVFGLSLSNQNSDPFNHALFTDLNTAKNLAIVIDMTGYADFSPSENGNVANFSFAASSLTGGSVEWIFNGSTLATTNITGGDFATYTVDLPPAFYGSESTLIARVGAGEIFFDNMQANGVIGAPIPEPSAAAAFAGLAGLGLALNRRRRRA